jgi:hypothetical protein
MLLIRTPLPVHDPTTKNLHLLLNPIACTLDVWILAKISNVKHTNASNYEIRDGIRIGSFHIPGSVSAQYSAQYSLSIDRYHVQVDPERDGNLIHSIWVIFHHFRGGFALDDSHAKGNGEFIIFLFAGESACHGVVCVSNAEGMA